MIVISDIVIIITIITNTIIIIVMITTGYKQSSHLDAAQHVHDVLAVPCAA